jgi:hypothetical protein
MTVFLKQLQNLLSSRLEVADRHCAWREYRARRRYGHFVVDNGASRREERRDSMQCTDQIECYTDIIANLMAIAELETLRTLHNRQNALIETVEKCRSQFAMSNSAKTGRTGNKAVAARHPGSLTFQASLSLLLLPCSIRNPLAATSPPFPTSTRPGS